MSKKDILPLLCTLLLLGGNWIVWNQKQVFILPPAEMNSPQPTSLPLARTADDIARGVLSLREALTTQQQLQLRPLYQEGSRLRTQLSQLHGNRQELRLQLVQDSRRILEQYP